MPNSVHGTTDTTGAVTISPRQTKTVWVVGKRGTNPSATEEVIFDVYSTTDAASKWGADAKAVDLVKILIDNGVSKIRGIMTKAVGDPNPTLADTYDAALDKLLVESDMGVVIVDDLTETVNTKLKDHLDLAEAEDKFRYGVIGAAIGAAEPALAGIATAMNNKRVFIAGPNVTDQDSGAELDGLHTAAGLAALIATETVDPALPMNGVEMIGLGGTCRVTLKSEKDAMLNAGVTPLYTSPSGRSTVYRLVTTCTKDTQGQDDPTWQEGTTVFIADDVMSAVQTRIRTNYKRTKNVTRILDSMKTDVKDVLEGKQGLEIIDSFDNLSVIKDPQDMYGALIDYTFDVVTPLYTVTINQHMKL